MLVTDEEDCSSSELAHFQVGSFLPADSPLQQQGLNTRCYHESLRPEPNNLYDVERYVRALRMLRPDNEPLVIFGAIAGVPPELVTDSALAEVDFTDKADTS